MTLRTLLILINVAAVLVIVVIVAAKVLSVRREPTERPAASGVFAEPTGWRPSSGARLKKA